MPQNFKFICLRSRENSSVTTKRLEVSWKGIIDQGLRPTRLGDGFMFLSKVQGL